jgi:hypothetical protein
VNLLSPPRLLTQSLGIDAVGCWRHTATPCQCCHAMPGPVRSSVGAFRSGCPLIHAHLRHACRQHRAGGVPTLSLQYDATAIHRLAGATPCVCFAAAGIASVPAGCVVAEHREGETARKNSVRAKTSRTGVFGSRADAIAVEGIFGRFAPRPTASVPAPPLVPGLAEQASDSQQQPVACRRVPRA